MAAKINIFDPPSSASSESDDGIDVGAEYLEILPDAEIDGDKHGNTFDTPTSPTTLPYCPRPPSAGSQKSPKCRRQRTTSLSHQSANKATTESVIRTTHRTIYTAGRPPWYNSEGQKVEPFVIGICGGSASGKTTVAEKIIESLGVTWVTLLSMDSFYRVLNQKQHEESHRNEYNFDHPDAFDFEILIETLKKLKEGRKVDVPIYNFVTHSRESRTKTMYGANVIIFEGILAFYNKEVREMLDMKIFVDTDADVRLARRLRRDISQRGRDLEGVLKQYTSMVQPSFNHYIAPLMVHADIIVPRGGENLVAIQLIVQHVHTQLQLRGLKIREELAQAHAFSGQPLPDTVKLLPTTPQIRGLHTFIRNKATTRDEFIFYSKRLIRLVIEYTLSLMKFNETIVETPQGVLYKGYIQSI
ncbi:hypothetical protein WA026_020184 [Henosepilachna vigintioctopunctata]|uniref:Uridine kinase n=1 Tax=Henosepilachna vigintioctopunctata TaxID=420089 RepID=A0AAW1UBI3_9CUCU